MKNTPAQQPPTKEALGLDFGNTLVTTGNGARSIEKQMSIEQFNRVQPIARAIEVVKRLVNERFGEHVYIVSKVTDNGKIKVSAWLEASGFYEQTGILREHVEFCAERHEKGPIVARLGITHFVDDRPEVMVHMPHVPHRILFQPNVDDYAALSDRLVGISIMQSWDEIEAALLETPLPSKAKTSSTSNP